MVSRGVVGGRSFRTWLVAERGSEARVLCDSDAPPPSTGREAEEHHDAERHAVDLRPHNGREGAAGYPRAQCLPTAGLLACRSPDACKRTMPLPWQLSLVHPPHMGIWSASCCP